MHNILTKRIIFFSVIEDYICDEAVKYECEVILVYQKENLENYDQYRDSIKRISKEEVKEKDSSFNSSNNRPLWWIIAKYHLQLEIVPYVAFRSTRQSISWLDILSSWRMYILHHLRYSVTESIIFIVKTVL